MIMTDNGHLRYLGKALVILLFVMSGIAAAQTENIAVTNKMVALSDGVKLSTDIYLPGEGNPFPVILIRTPYASKQLGSVANHFASAGYAVVVQNVRGKSGSEGQFFPFVFEKKDGFDCLEWITKQPWCNGKIGLWGESYLSYTGFVLAPSGHPSFVTMINISGMADMESFFFPGGAFHLMAHLPWYYVNVGGNPFPPDEVWKNIFRTTPLFSLFGGDQAKEQIEMFKGIEDEYEKVSIPIFHITGLYDFVYPNTMTIYNNINRQGSSFQKLVIGPWIHDDVFTGKSLVGDVDFGKPAKRTFDELLNMSVRWFDYWLKGNENGIREEPVVEYFVMGKNEWRTAGSWPPENVTKQRWYISSEKGANSSSGDGYLSREHATAEGTDTFVFDPNDPVPTVGGANFHYFKNNVGIKNQSEIAAREDVLVYTSDPLSDGLEIVGPLKMVLYAATEGEDTDFTARVVELRADGYAQIIEEGIVRGRYRESMDVEKWLEPSNVYELVIDLGSTATYLKPGSRLRLEISSSNFPKYDRNPNTKVHPLEATEFKKVKQTIHFSKEHPSHLEVHVIK